MIAQPAFYESVRQKAAGHWDQLEQDPELAGPWHQLFKQVQSPRHILSELLQNADDAGATEASVRIEKSDFHIRAQWRGLLGRALRVPLPLWLLEQESPCTPLVSGGSVSRAHSASVTASSYSPPSLSVCFHRRRFTEPHWLSENVDTLGNTRVVVDIYDQHRQKEVEKNLEEWLKSPVSLLFFKSIRRMWIGDQEVHLGQFGSRPRAGQ